MAETFIKRLAEYLGIIKGLVYLGVIICSLAFFCGQFVGELREIKMELAEIKIALKTEYVTKMEYEYHCLSDNVKILDLKDRMKNVEDEIKIIR